jgi:hypothetical protein
VEQLQRQAAIVVAAPGALAEAVLVWSASAVQPQRAPDDRSPLVEVRKCPSPRDT